MELWEAIKGRRSVGVMKQQLPPREHIHQMLEAASWAPSHYRTEPWRFFVLTGSARERLGEAMAAIVHKQLDDPKLEGSQARLKREKEKPLRAPVIIAVVVSPGKQDKVMEIEEIEAVACAIQNMMLAAHELGLGTIWRTGSIIYKEELKAFFSLTDREKLVGLVYVGYPDQKLKTPSRKPISGKTIWME